LQNTQQMPIMFAWEGLTFWIHNIKGVKENEQGETRSERLLILGGQVRQELADGVGGEVAEQLPEAVRRSPRLRANVAHGDDRETRQRPDVAKPEREAVLRAEVQGVQGAPRSEIAKTDRAERVSGFSERGGTASSFRGETFGIFPVRRHHRNSKNKSGR